jgi:hypothetical protein
LSDFSFFPPLSENGSGRKSTANGEENRKDGSKKDSEYFTPSMVCIVNKLEVAHFHIPGQTLVFSETIEIHQQKLAPFRTIFAYDTSHVGRAPFGPARHSHPNTWMTVSGASVFILESVLFAVPQIPIHLRD